ncbi:MAG: DUF222 domain-containing protein [Ancrocorticia sp.]
MSAQSVLEFDWPEEPEPECASASVTAGVESSGGLVAAEPLERLTALAAACAEISPQDMTVHECIAAVERVTLIQTRLAGVKSAALARIGELQKRDEGEPVPLGSVKIPGTHRTVFDLVEKGGGQSRETSRKEIQRAEAIAGPYPLFGQAIRAGQISAEYLDILTRCIRDESLKAKASGCEAELLARALREPLSAFGKSVRAWMVANAPVAAERDARRNARKESFRIFHDDDGVTVHGWFTALNGLVVEKAIRAMVGVPSREDTRSHDQRQAQALLDLVSGAVGEGPQRLGADAGGEADGGARDVVGADDVREKARSGLRDGSSGDCGARGDDGGLSAGSADVLVGRQSGASAVGAPRFQISVHVPLETLVQTQRAIEKGCWSLEELDRRKLGGGGAADSSGGMWGSRLGETETGSGLTGYGGSATGVGGTERSGCYETGVGLGARGSCLSGRAEVTKQLGRVLATIRAGTDPNMLAGFPSAILEDGTPLVPSKLAQLLCDSSLVRIVMSARGEPLDASHAQRLFSTTQTRAIHARDRSCRFPGCDRGVSMSQIHHAQQWEKGGKTVVDNAVMLCWHHHEVIHRDEITIAHHAGGFAFFRPSGALIGVTMHESGRAMESAQ